MQYVDKAEELGEEDVYFSVNSFYRSKRKTETPRARAEADERDAARRAVTHTATKTSSKRKRTRKMGDSTGSMFYAFTAFLVIYFIGAAVYYGHKFISGKLRKK